MESVQRQGKKVKLEDKFDAENKDLSRKSEAIITNNNSTDSQFVDSSLTSMRSHSDADSITICDTNNDLTEMEDIPVENGMVDEAKMPEVFQTDDLSMEERWNVIFSQILADRKPFEVERGFYHYLEENVQDGDWQAVWRSHHLKCDILVEVIHLEAEYHKAKVEIITPFCYEPNSNQVVHLTQGDVERVLESFNNKVSLLELFPVFDESGDLDETAVALEHLRFFYDFIWRLSDEGDDGDYIYVQRHLEQRMKMYYDVKNKALSAFVAEKYNETMSDYQQQYWQLKLKRAQYDPDSNVDDEGPEIPEDEMAEMTELCEDLDVLMKTLEKLEDPVMRAIVMKGSSEKKNKTKRSSEDRHSRLNQERITHLVAEKFTVGMMKNLDLDDDTIIMQHTNIKQALDCCYNGDTMLLFPGKYSGEGFYNLSLSVDIKGLGQSASDVIIVCQEQVGIFVDCTAFRLSISNMTFETEAQESPSFAALDVRTGNTTLTNCVFRSLWQPVLVSKEGTLTIERCKIHGFMSPGVRVSAGGTLTMTNTHVYDCGRHMQNGTTVHSCGILVEADEGAEGLDKTTIDLHGNKIEHTNGPGICIQIHSTNQETKSDNVATEEELKQVLPACIAWQGSENDFAEDKDASICVRYVEPDL